MDKTEGGGGAQPPIKLCVACFEYRKPIMRPNSQSRKVFYDGCSSISRIYVFRNEVLGARLDALVNPFNGSKISSNPKKYFAATISLHEKWIQLLGNHYLRLIREIKRFKYL